MWLSSVMHCVGFRARSTETDRSEQARSNEYAVARQGETVSRRWGWRPFGCLLGALLLGLAGAPSASAETILTFDEFASGTTLTTQYQGLGVTASGPVVVYNALISPWPAHSGTNMAFAPTGLMTFYLDSTIIGNIQSVSVFLSGASSTGVYAYDASGALVGQSITQGWTDNAFVKVTSAGNPISSVAIHDGGSSFIIDDLAFSSSTNPSYSVTPLGLGGSGGGVSPHGINGSGQVAGFSATSSGANHAFFYPGTTIQDLGTLGGSSSAASAVNGSGLVVGVADTKNKLKHAFAWTQAGGMADLGTLGGNNSIANAINDSGQIVGSAQTRKNLTHAFSWSSGLMVDLGTLGGDNSVATDVNAAGQVVGSAQARKGLTHAFLWASGVITDLGTLGGKTSSANAINANGQVVGTAQTTNGQSHAFFWSTANGMIDLGTLGGTGSAASAINDNGQVIGSAQLANGSHAFSWTAGGGRVDLGTLGGTESVANGVNTVGQVVGSAQDTSGQWRAFVWTATDGMVDLNTRLVNAPANLTLLSALAISDNGAIVALSDTGVVLLTPQ